ncbi:hypothetical protein ACP70R_038826 [Stipagrostis hirtigluma subsp. patula]
MPSTHDKQMPPLGLDLPCLALHHRDHATALLSVANHKPVVAGHYTDEPLRNKVICPTAQGLLLVRDPGTTSTFLWNPQSGEEVQLPILGGVQDFVLMHSHCLLSDMPAAPGCIVLLVEVSNTFIWYCHPGDDHWAKYDYDIGFTILDKDVYEKDVICPIAACRGKLYFNATATELGLLDFSGAEPELSTIAIDSRVAPDGSYGYRHEDDPGRIFLVESDGELYMIRLLFPSPYEGGDEIEDATVHKMDFSVRRWRNVYDLGGRTFLLSRHYFGASCSGGGELGLRPDHIYFACSRTKSLHVFGVEEDTYEHHRLDEAPTSDKAFWLLPAQP